MGTDWLHERRGTCHVLSNVHGELLWQGLWGGDSNFRWEAQLSSISSSILKLLWLLIHASLSSAPRTTLLKTIIRVPRYGTGPSNGKGCVCSVYIGHQFFLNRNDVFKLAIVNWLRGKGPCLIHLLCVRHSTGHLKRWAKSSLLLKITTACEGRWLAHLIKTL